MLTLSLKDILLAVLLVAVIVLVIYIIVLLKRLMPSVIKLNQITDDALKITKTAKESMDDVQGVIADLQGTATDVTKSFGNICKLLDGNKHTVSALTNLTNATAAILNLFKK